MSSGGGPYLGPPPNLFGGQMYIIVKDGKPKGETRTKIDERLRNEGWGSTFRSEEDRDKCEFVERKIKKETGGDKNFVRANLINMVE